MIDQLLDSIRHETEVVKHLVSKIPDGGLEWRPTPAQRSTLELLQYLTWCSIVPVTAALDGGWDHAAAARESGEALGVEQIPAAMDAQVAALSDKLAGISDADLESRTATLPWGLEVKLGRALVDMGVKSLTAYRMQLFLYCKEAGNPDIWSPNCWVGIDRERPAS